MPGAFHFLARGEIDGNPPALIAIAGLHHDRRADLLGDDPGIGGIGHRAPRRHRNTRLGEQRPGQFLVLRDRFGHGTGAIGFRRQNPALLCPLPQPHQRALRQPAERNPPGLGRFHNGAGARSELHIQQQPPQALQFCAYVEGIARDSGKDQPMSGVDALNGKFFLDVFNRHAIDTAGGGSAGPAIPHDRPAECLQFERDMLQHVAHPGAVAHPLKKSAALADRAAVFDHARQPLHDAVVETGERVGGEVFQMAQIDPRFENRKAGPLVGTTQNLDLLNLHG